MTDQNISLVQIEDIVKAYVLEELKKQSESPMIIDLNYKPSGFFNDILTKEDFAKTQKIFDLINSQIDVQKIDINNTNNNLISIVNKETNNNYDIDGCTSIMLSALKGVNLSFDII